MIKKILTLSSSSVLQLVIRSVAFFYLAFLLSFEDLGYFSISITVATLAINAITFGSYNLVMERVAKKLELIDFFKKEVIFYIINISIYLVLICTVNHIFSLGVPLNIFLLFSVAEIFQAGTLFVLSSYLFSVSEIKTINRLKNINTLNFVFIYLVFVFISDKTIISWAVLYFIGSLLVVCSYLYIIRRIFIVKELERNVITQKHRQFSYVARIKLGNQYFISSVVRSVYTASDKLLISQMLGYTALGIYTLAERVLNAIFIPLSSFLQLKEPFYYEDVCISKKYLLVFKSSIFSFVYFGLIYISYVGFGKELFLLLNFPSKFFDSFLLLNSMLILVFSLGFFTPVLHFLNGTGRVSLRIIVVLCALFLFVSIYSILNDKMDALNSVIVSLSLSQVISALPFYLRFVYRLCLFQKTI